MGDMAARGYVEMRDWTSGDQKLTTLTFPGLPIPLEPTFAIHDGWIFKGLTPQAVLGAIDQAKGKTSLLDNAAMTEMASGPLEDLMSFGWLDAPALLSDGYGWTAALGAMLSNGVRSPRDSSRGAGLIVPPFNRLAAGAKPTVLLGRMVGADLVATGQTDRSVLVNATAMFGVIDRFAVLLVPFVFAGAAIPARMAQRYGSQNDHGYYDEWEELDDMGYLDDVGYGEDTGYGGDEDGGGDDDDDDGGGGGGGDDEDGR
jgi:hypothetical protein